MTNLRCQLLASVASVVLVGAASTASADQLLTGSITSATGQKLEGVQVSAKKEGSTITTSVYTDQSGAYYLPSLPAGKYNVWAQALGFDVARASVDLSGGRQVSRLGAGAGLRDLEGRGRVDRRQTPGLQARCDHRPRAEDQADAVGNARRGIA